MPDNPQPKGPTPQDIALERKARALLSVALPLSISDKIEYGAVICRDDRTGALSETERRASAESDNQVDVGQYLPNCGCPAGTTPVAYYHTHPFDRVAGGTMRADPNFSTPDMQIANDYQLVAFLGSRDGLFRRYDPPERPTQIIDGKKVLLATDPEGRPLPETFSTPRILNGKLPTR